MNRIPRVFGRRGGVRHEIVNKLRIFFINIQSLGNKLDELLLYLDLVQPDIVCLAEHWYVSDDILNLNFPNFTLAAHSGRACHLHGGTAIYIKHSINFRSLKERVSAPSEMDVEYCAVDLSDYNIIFVCMYRPSTSANFNTFFNAFESLMINLLKTKKAICVLGDFNIDLVRDRVAITSTFDDILTSFNLITCVTEPTRELRCIDNIFTTLDASDLKVEVVKPALSDHDGLLFEIKRNSRTHTARNDMHTIYVNRITDSGVAGLVESLNREVWPSSCLEVNTQARYLVEVFLKHMKVHCPLKKQKKTF